MRPLRQVAETRTKASGALGHMILEMRDGVYEAWVLVVEGQVSVWYLFGGTKFSKRMMMFLNRNVVVIALLLLTRGSWAALRRYEFTAGKGVKAPGIPFGISLFFLGGL